MSSRTDSWGCLRKFSLHLLRNNWKSKNDFVPQITPHPSTVCERNWPRYERIRVFKNRIKMLNLFALKFCLAMNFDV